MGGGVLKNGRGGDNDSQDQRTHPNCNKWPDPTGFGSDEFRYYNYSNEITEGLSY